MFWLKMRLSQKTFLLVSICHYLIKRNPGHVSIQLFGLRSHFWPSNTHTQIFVLAKISSSWFFFFSQRASHLSSNIYIKLDVWNCIVWNLCSQGCKCPYIINMKPNPSGVILSGAQLDGHLLRLFSTLSTWEAHSLCSARWDMKGFG